MQGTQRCSASFDSVVRDCTPFECITPASQLNWKTAGRCTACSHLGPSHAATAPGRHAMPAAKSARTCQASGSATHPFSALHALSVHCPTLNARFKQAQARTGSHCCGIASGHSSHSSLSHAITAPPRHALPAGKSARTCQCGWQCTAHFLSPACPVTSTSPRPTCASLRLRSAGV